MRNFIPTFDEFLFENVDFLQKVKWKKYYDKYALHPMYAGDSDYVEFVKKYLDFSKGLGCYKVSMTKDKKLFSELEKILGTKIDTLTESDTNDIYDIHETEYGNVCVVQNQRGDFRMVFIPDVVLELLTGKNDATVKRVYTPDNKPKNTISLYHSSTGTLPNDKFSDKYVLTFFHENFNQAVYWAENRRAGTYKIELPKSEYAKLYRLDFTNEDDKLFNYKIVGQAAVENKGKHVDLHVRWDFVLKDPFVVGYIKKLRKSNSGVIFKEINAGFGSTDYEDMLKTATYSIALFPETLKNLTAEKINLI